MVGILVSLWDFEWILPIFRGELLISREKNRVRFHGGSIHPLKLPGCWDGQSMTRNEHEHQVGSLLGLSRFAGDLLQMISLRVKAVTF